MQKPYKWRYSSNKYKRKINCYQQLIANSFNNYYLSVVDKITNDIINDKTLLNSNNPIHFLHKKYTTPKEIEKIIKSLKSKNPMDMMGFIRKF
jgi:hypothetical protein